MKRGLMKAAVTAIFFASSEEFVGVVGGFSAAAG
jgi:hypothetical protein